MADLSFLKKKEMGLPLWAWALIVAVLMFLLYRHYKNAGGSSNSQTPVGDTSQASPADTSNAGDLGGGSGGGSLGGAADNSSDLATIAQELAPFSNYYQSLLDSTQGTQTDTNPPDNAGNTDKTPTASTSGLEWNGQTFKSRADFNAYLKSKGLSVKQFAARHPAAYGIYLALPSGNITTAAPKSSILGSAKAASGKITSGISRAIKPGYQTFKKDVKLSAGQTVHYTPGKGYYAANGEHPSAVRQTITRPQTRAPISSRFYTYKSQVRLGQGQTLHYTKGRGYYGA